MTISPPNHYMQLNKELYLTADKRQWKIGKLVKRTNGKIDFQASHYVYLFNDLLKVLLEYELKEDFSATDIVSLQLEHKKAVETLSSTLRHLATSEQFKQLCYLRNGVGVRE